MGQVIEQSYLGNPLFLNMPKECITSESIISKTRLGMAIG